MKTAPNARMRRIWVSTSARGAARRAGFRPRGLLGGAKALIDSTATHP